MWYKTYSSKDVMYNANLKQVINDVIEQMNRNGGAYILGSPNLQIGSDQTKIKNDAFYVVRDGIISTIASTDTALTATSHNIKGGNEAIFNVYLDEKNVITLLKGVEVATAVPATSVCPSTPSGGLKIGEVKIATTSDFKAGTTELDDNGVTTTYTNKTDDDTISFSDYEAKHWLYHDNLENLIEDLVSILSNDGVEILTSAPGLAIGTTDPAKIKHNAFTTFKDGVIKSIPAGEVAFTPTTDDLADGYGAVYLVYLDGTTVKILKGTATLGGTGAVCPATPAGKVKLGEVKIVTSGAAFTAGTTLLSATTITDTYTDKTDVISSSANFDVSSYGLEKYKYSKNFYNLLDDLEEDLNSRRNNRVLSNPTLARGTSDQTKVKNSAFVVDRSGVISTISSTETAFTATTDDLADGEGAVYLVYLDKDNAITILKGTPTAGGVGAECPEVPGLYQTLHPSGLKIGEVKIVAVGKKFDATTDSLASTWLTVTYTNKIGTFDKIS